jgi:hypothetical protein
MVRLKLWLLLAGVFACKRLEAILNGYKSGTVAMGGIKVRLVWQVLEVFQQWRIV